MMSVGPPENGARPPDAYPVFDDEPRPQGDAVDPEAWGHHVPAPAPSAATRPEASSTKPKGGAKKEGGGDGGSSTLVVGFRLYLALTIGVGGVACCVLWPSQLLAAVVHPATTPSLEDSACLLAFICACIGTCAAIDLLVAGRFKGRYFALHTGVNALVIALSFLDTIDFFTQSNPLASVTCLDGRSACGSKGPVALTASLHFWHMLGYALKPIDWVHHLPALIFCFVGLYYPFGPILNYSLLMGFMGVPGCIDYAMLTLVKQGMLAARVEKDLNQTLNVWLRCPCLVIAGYLQLVDPLVHGDEYFDLVHRLIVILSGVHAMWNGCFFMYRTVDARTKFVLKSEADKKVEPTAKSDARALM